jgi:YHS domain-containing protein
MKYLLTTIVLLLSFIHVGYSQSTGQPRHANLEKGLAIQGYDPVAYFTQKKAVKGLAQYAAKSNGALYYFSSQSNRDAFVKNPVAYEPQYGGWCAYAMGATGEKVEIDPETFKVLNGKLYLFYHSWTNNTLTKWNKDEVNLKAAADKNWVKTIGQ